MNAHEATGAALNRRTLLGGTLALIAAGAVAACGASQNADKPVPIQQGDTCARCGMMITDMRFAAEIVGESQVWKFDDTDEMFLYYHEKLSKQRIRAWWAHDYHTLKWLPAKTARYVVSSQIKAPMCTGVAAFHDAGAAQQFATSVSGVVRAFSQMLAEPAECSPAPQAG